MKFLLMLAIAALVMLAIRTYAFTIYTVSDAGLSPVLDINNRVLVNKLSKKDFAKGSLMVFHTDADYIGKVSSLPGDTIEIGARVTYCPIPVVAGIVNVWKATVILLIWVRESL